jgi:pimeloyl-ACP methyl ester carboxylesterase
MRHLMRTMAHRRARIPWERIVIHTKRKMGFGLMWALLLPLLSHAGDAPVEGSVNATFRDIRKITTKEGIEQQELVTIGGVPQWISIRSRDRSAPVLLVLHGGPGFTLSPVSDYYMRDWEEFFTVVQWDQRAAGKSYRSADKAALAPTLTIDRLVLDAEEMVEHLRKRLKQDRVVVLAHSFGTIIGVKLAARRPDLLHAYVGMGQFVDFMRSEELGYQQTLADARADQNKEAITQLEALAPFPDRARPERNLQNLGIERRWLAHYGGYFRAGGEGQHHAVARLSPTHTAEDLVTRQDAHNFIVENMWDQIPSVDLSKEIKFEVPILIMQGRYDRGTASALVDEWYANVQAPHKKLVWFEQSSHMVYEEEPGKLLMALVNDVLPLTRVR